MPDVSIYGFCVAGSGLLIGKSTGFTADLTDSAALAGSTVASTDTALSTAGVAAGLANSGSLDGVATGWPSDLAASAGTGAVGSAEAGSGSPFAGGAAVLSSGLSGFAWLAAAITFCNFIRQFVA